jgi:hypothetical protein
LFQGSLDGTLRRETPALEIFADQPVLHRDAKARFDQVSATFVL